MDKELLNNASCIVVILSIVPYAWRTYQKKIQPLITTWSLWTVIVLVVFLTIKDSGDNANIWPIFFSLLNTLIVTILAIRAKDKYERMRFSKIECVCIALIVSALLVWMNIRDKPELVQFVLYGAVFANIVASAPTVINARANPASDRPMAWALLLLGYILALLAIEEYTSQNYVFPVFVIALATWMTATLTLYRLKNRIHIREWV